ncbi:hypothetical protein GGP41_006571 [Bipolaris sorokiniana]|uniref:Uncharacterized protein n=2 Tax=Cochliobolus sativus TaxID=45130 RepID=A0A8H5ZP03_COCSA|nr:uncharacterized protein COCSADRAFT_36696 [Bipolaris sorokiniana ND90Pr]EMD64115.1 hypothetical protein COCSADRAFT_36696 [Bipolaris sorokiniana ND90Pr]KAF5853811.1 hypothetical protein GGP41_006571 [Bipolaris sorokiniana]
MVNSALHLLGGPNSQPYGPVPVTEDPSTSEAKKAPAYTTTTPIVPGLEKSSSQSWSAVQIALTLAIPLVALITWLACVRANPRIFDTFAGEEIGGRLSQAQAKAIDVITGAILAPMFMAAVNYVWFASARVSVVNEQQSKPVPLRTLVAASGTSGGNYDLFHLRNLLLGKTWSLATFALLTILSAVSRTALSNVIAYEAFSELSSSKTLAALRLQTDAVVNANLGMDNYLKLRLYDFDMSQNAQVAKDMMSLLTDLSYEDAASKLTNGTYVGVNATTQSLRSLPPSISKLENVPAYRISVDCIPDLPLSISVMQPLGPLNTQIGLMLNTTTKSNNTIFQANYPGVPQNIQTGDGDSYTYVAFSLGYREAYLGHLERFNLSNSTTPSQYGDVGYRAFNMSQWKFNGTQGNMSISGLRCVLYREQGLANSTRVPSNDSSISGWTIDTTSFPSSQEKAIVPSLLAKFQWSNFNFHAPGSVIPGLGPALNKMHAAEVEEWGTRANDTFTNFSLNFLYASGETQRIIYEVAASSKNASHHRPEYTINVPAFEMQQQYRITYVPSILLVGMVCLVGAAAITGIMALYTRKSFSARAHRQVDVTRLLLDSVVGLGAEANDLARVAQRGNDELDVWAAGCKVRYTSMGDDDGSVQVVLEKTHS